MTTLEEMESALSLERFSRYVAWANGDREHALELYELNVKLSEALYSPLQMLEVSLRNRIDLILSRLYGERWFENGGLLNITNQVDQLSAALVDLARDGKEPLPGRVVACLTFSFWTAMFSPAYENLWRGGLNEIAKRPDGRRLARKDFSRRLTPVRILRNRIAHHEPILHWDLTKHHSAIHEVTRWLSPAAADWTAKIDRFPSVYPAEGYILIPSAASDSNNCDG